MRLDVVSDWINLPLHSSQALVLYFQLKAWFESLGSYSTDGPIFRIVHYGRDLEVGCRPTGVPAECNSINGYSSRHDMRRLPGHTLNPWDLSRIKDCVWDATVSGTDVYRDDQRTGRPKISPPTTPLAGIHWPRFLSWESSIIQPGWIWLVKMILLKKNEFSTEHFAQFSQTFFV